jgi:hypothetical protein
MIMRKALAIVSALLCSAAVARAQSQSPSPSASRKEDQEEKKKKKKTDKKADKKAANKDASPATVPGGSGTANKPGGKPPLPKEVAIPVPAPNEPSIPASQPPRRVTAAAFLTPLESEEPGIGLYSYILLGSRPESPSSERWLRYHRTIVAFLRMPDMHEILPYVPPERRNITFLPTSCSVSELPKAPTDFFRFAQERLERYRMEHQEAGEILSHDIGGPYSRSNPEATASVLVSSYDYARAEALLSLLRSPHTEGPYIISATQPLSKLGTLPSQYLYQDLSSVPPRLVLLWINEFMSQAQEPEFWRTRTGEQFILRLRTAIAVAGEQMPDFSGAIRWQLATFTPQR